MVSRMGLALCLGVPFSLLLLSYAWLAFDHGTLLLWNVLVHESGRYTLGETVFYVSHFLREVPVDVAYALFVLAAWPRTGGRNGRVSRRRALVVAWVAGSMALVLISFATWRAAEQHGWATAWADFLQYRTRDDLTAYGSHWHYHWLSTLWFGSAALLSAPLACRLFTTANAMRRRTLGWAAWGYFVGMTLLFGISADVFTDVRYAGHQAREIMTHGPLTLLLALAALHLAGRWVTEEREPTSRDRTPTVSGMVGWLYVVMFFCIPLMLVLVAFSGDVMEAGQSEHGLSAMVGGHFFEHILDYLLVILLTLSGYCWLEVRSGNKRKVYTAA